MVYDQWFRIRLVSDTLQVIRLEDENPDDEYLLKYTDMDTGKVSRINKAYLLAKWKPVEGGIQTKLFVNDRTEKVKTILKFK